MDKIIINKDVSIRVDTFDWQVSPKGNVFRYIGLKVNESKPSIFVDTNGKIVNQFTRGRIEKWHWIYEFIYEDGSRFEIEIDYNNKFLHKTIKK